MQDDRELLEAAAKAMGEKVPPRFFDNGTACLLSGQHWNPLTDDGDALRLAVKLNFDVVQFLSLVRVDCQIGCGYFDVTEHHGTDPYAATRRAIVRAAAEMAKP